jgi:hypothetical protein
MRPVWTVGSAGAAALSPSTDACGIAGGASVIAILKDHGRGGELIERGSERSAGGVVHCGTTDLGRTAGTRPWSFVSDHAAAPSRPGAARLVPASSALISRAMAFRAALEPLIPLLRKARRDTGFPAAASLLAIRRAWPVSV